MTEAEGSARVSGAVDGTRVLRRLNELAEIGADPPGGVTRLAFSREERAATDLLASWMREAGLTIAFDSFGNMFGSTDQNVAGNEVSMAGSHVDTVPQGGRFDGALGVIGALESVLAMNATDLLPEIPLEVVVWRCEEPVCFSQGKVGSLLFSGQIDLDDLRPITDPPVDISWEMERDGVRPQRSGRRRVRSCLELHIEQGKRLEREGVQVGVVTAVAAPIRLRITIVGRADHSGATPMAERYDALAAAAEIILAVERAGRDESPHESVATTANVECRPGAMNVIPGEVTLLVDVRGIDSASMDRVVTAIEIAARAVAEERTVSVKSEMLSKGVPTIFHDPVVDLLQRTVASLGFEVRTMPSGAGHDAQCLADMAEVGMLFVPSVGGISHSPLEVTRDEDVVTGVRALAGCWWSLATASRSPAVL